MKNILILFSNYSFIKTRINGEHDEIKNHYIGKEFFDDNNNETKKTCIAVLFQTHEARYYEYIEQCFQDSGFCSDRLFYSEYVTDKNGKERCSLHVTVNKSYGVFNCGVIEYINENLQNTRSYYITS